MSTRTFCIALLLAACAPSVDAQQRPPIPAVRPDADNRHWVLLEDLRYELGDTGVFIVVPAGFVTDYASIPQAMWSTGLSPHGRYSRAAIIHDWLFWSQGCTMEQANRLMVIAMKESDVAAFDEQAIHAGVAVGGRRSWDQNAQERSQGLPRIVPPAFGRLPDHAIWPEYRATLKEWGVRDPAFERNPAYCAYGETTQVPRRTGATLPKSLDIPLQPLGR